MKLLYYVTPSVVGTEACLRLTIVTQHMTTRSPWRCLRAVAVLVSYLITRLMCLIVGFDAFLVKFRMASVYIDEEEVSYDAVLGAVIFLFQILCVVNLNWFVRERLFIFTFAGEDGTLDSDERARVEVWNALIARRIYEQFGFWRFLVVMLGFDDYDYQMLVL